MIPKLIAGASLLLLTACAQPDAAPKVASLNTSSGAPTSNSPSEEQPRLRLDMGEEEKKRLYDAHTACLKEHDPAGTGQRAGAEGSKQYSDAAWEACRSKWPLPPWEMDAKNPTFKDNWHKHVQCLNQRGMKVVETEPGSWTYDGVTTLSQEERTKIEKDCEKEVFGGTS